MQKRINDVWVEYKGYDILFRKGWSEYDKVYVIEVIRPDGSAVNPDGEVRFGKGVVAGSSRSAGKYARNIVDWDALPEAEKVAKRVEAESFCFF